MEALLKVNQVRGPKKPKKKEGSKEANDTLRSREKTDTIDDAGGGAKKEAGDFAGTAPEINPGYPGQGRTNNCVNCTIATDSTFAGRPATAVPHHDTNGLPISEIPKALGISGKFRSTKGIDDIASQMKELGPDSRGVVFASRGPGKTGHVFNVVTSKVGKVKFWDGQTKSIPVIDGQGYKDFFLLNTTN